MNSSIFTMDAVGWTIAAIGGVIGGIVGYALFGGLFTIPFVIIGVCLSVGIHWIVRGVRRGDEPPGADDDGA